MQKNNFCFLFEWPNHVDRKTSWRTVDANARKDALVEVYVANLGFAEWQCVPRSNFEHPSNFKNFSKDSEDS